MTALAIDAPGAGGGGWHSHNFLVGMCRLRLKKVASTERKYLHQNTSL